MSYVKFWAHCVWGTKNKAGFLSRNIKETIFNHIRENAKLKDIHINIINGGKDHVHCLISLNPDQCISKVMGLIKGESSHWINKDKIVNYNFEWADEYFAVSVSESQLEIIRNYIKNQEEHHRIHTWEEEYNKFMIKYRFQRLKG